VRNGYDYIHSTLGTNHVVMVILIIAAVCILGGLTLGLSLFGWILN